MKIALDVHGAHRGISCFGYIPFMSKRGAEEPLPQSTFDSLLSKVPLHCSWQEYYNNRSTILLAPICCSMETFRYVDFFTIMASCTI